MANKAISELPEALNVNNQDLFVLEQGGLAKKLPAETFITEQGIIDALAEALDGHGGIQSVTLSSVSGRIRTYLITFTDQSATTFQVYDGTSIDRIVKTSTAGLTDTYTVFMNDGSTTFFTVTNGADGTVSEAMLNDALKDKAPVITETTESSVIATFPDGADDLVMHNIIATIEPVQSGSGDPSPSNIRPISGWTGCNVTRCGKNRLDKNEAYFSSSNAYWGGTASSFSGSFVLGAGQYTISCSHVMAGVYVHQSDDVRIHIAYNKTSSTFTNPTDQALKITVYITGVTLADMQGFDYQLEAGTTATTYEPYQDTTLTVDWSSEAGTVYGGTIDVATGLLTVDRVALIFDGTQQVWLANWRPFTNTVGWLYKLEVTPGIDPTTITATTLSGSKLLSDTLPTLPYSGTNNIFSTDTPGISIVGGDTYGIVMRVNDTSLTTATAINAWLAEHPVTVVYPLATPQTYQLTGQQLATLLGTNNVQASTGNVSVTYTADTKMYIEKLTQPTEDDMTANQAITSGKFFMVGNNLYIATAAIASGAKIIEGTNATRLSLADALNRL